GKLREALRQHLCDPLMVLTPPALEQRLVRCLLYERMLEHIGGVRRYTARVKKLGTHQARQRPSQRRFIERADRQQYPVRELAAKARAPLSDFPGAAQPIEACPERVLERSGDGQREEQPS